MDPKTGKASLFLLRVSWLVFLNVSGHFKQSSLSLASSAPLMWSTHPRYAVGLPSLIPFVVFGGCYFNDLFKNVFSKQATPSVSGFFEVTVNGELVHSKSKGEGFPDEKKIAAIVAKVCRILFLWYCCVLHALPEVFVIPDHVVSHTPCITSRVACSPHCVPVHIIIFSFMASHLLHHQIKSA